MNSKFKVGKKVYIKGILPLNIYDLVDYHTTYIIVSIDYYLSHPITIVANNTYIALTFDCVKLAS